MFTANLRTKIQDSRGSDSSRILSVRGGILISIGNFPEMLSQAILVGIILVGRLGVPSECQEKAVKQGRAVCLGLFSYPVLMAADILLYQARATRGKLQYFCDDPVCPDPVWKLSFTAAPQTKHLDFTGFGSSRFLTLQGGIPRP